MAAKPTRKKPVKKAAVAKAAPEAAATTEETPEVKPKRKHAWFGEID